MSTNNYRFKNYEGLRNRVLVNQDNAVQILGGTIDSTKEYFIDGLIDLGNTSIEVPAGGINLKGYDFNISCLTSSANNYTMFTSPVGGSGNVIIHALKIITNGLNSQVYDLTSATGFEAIEVTELNYENCTSLGEITSYRQGLELNTGRFGGTPELTLSGLWIGGYVVDLSLTRAITDGSYSLFKAGPGFIMLNRFKSNANVDLNSTVSYMDFSPLNLPNEDTLELLDGRITRNTVLNASDTTLIPNINQGDLSSFWRNNVGINNTFVGGTCTIDSEVATVIPIFRFFVDLAGVWNVTGLEHMDSPAPGQLRNLGSSPREFKIDINMTLDCAPNREIDLKIVTWDDSTASFVDWKSVRRVVNNLQGGRDVAFFTFTSNIILDQNDYVKIQVANTTDTTNITAETGSEFIVEER